MAGSLRRPGGHDDLHAAEDRESGVRYRLLLRTDDDRPRADSLKPTVQWQTAPGNNEVKNDSIHAVMCTPLVTEDYVYGVGRLRDLRCLDAKTGKLVWETREATGEGPVVERIHRAAGRRAHS